MIGMESFGVEGEYKPIEFTYTGSDPIASRSLYKLFNTVCLIFVADRIHPTTGNRETLEVRSGEGAVGVYSCEDIQLPKVAGVAIHVGDAVYWSGVNGTGVSSNWQTGWLRIGICKQAADAGDEYVLCDLHGDHPIAEPAP